VLQCATLTNVVSVYTWNEYRVAVCCSVLQCATLTNVVSVYTWNEYQDLLHSSLSLQCIAVCCGVLQCVAACGSVLQCQYCIRRCQYCTHHHFLSTSEGGGRKKCMGLI